eukprot:CAMPEP_0175887330 /NCGR_PEP_ID=MMETSP0107_2-20121207/46109_1 /TAXON_ID=195067 ORGANISM="Goniomonas pacifica, Strain CCMP1869" /NCGR_SAMPLE_ID=MMETSP0107_2 /ASSEMBLY_ACC=CAM_ASM_000203 /LENGTH=32 /DNA_ID= /DNA_START= /DNA_END= /DNA_ORIENTATION=
MNNLGLRKHKGLRQPTIHEWEAGPGFQAGATD